MNLADCNRRVGMKVGIRSGNRPVHEPTGRSEMTCTQQETQKGCRHRRALSPSLNKEDCRESLEVPVEQCERELEDTRTAADLEGVWKTTEEE